MVCTQGAVTEKLGRDSYSPYPVLLSFCTLRAIRKRRQKCETAVWKIAYGDSFRECCMVRSSRDDEKKGWNRAFRDREECKEPRRASFKTCVAFDKNNLKSTETLRKYRGGYRHAWRVPAARSLLLKCGFKRPGTYNPNNQQGGVMFALPREVPGKTRFTSDDAGMVLRHVFKAGSTLSQCESVRKMLSAAFQLQTGDDGNFKGCKQQWDCQKPELYGEPTQKVLAEVSIEPEGQKTCFTTEWSPETGMSYYEWSPVLLVVHDWTILGARSQACLSKIKRSVEHTFVPSEGWMRTKMVGGRAKLEKKKGIRPWSAYRVCFCPNGKHQGLPANWRDIIDTKQKPTWCTTCPLTAFQVVREMLPDDDHRTYPTWLPAQHRYAKTNIGKEKIFVLAQRWVNLQGGNPDGLVFDTNSGRKALGKWCDEFDVKYSLSFEIHGDLWCTWRKYYQNGLKKEPAFARRTQSPLPELCCAALRRFARAIGRGRTVREDPKEFTMQQLVKLMALNLRTLGKGSEVAEILDN